VKLGTTQFGLFDDDQKDRRAEHIETTKTLDPLDLSGGFALKGPERAAQGQGDASCASVAVALRRRIDSIPVDCISPERAKHTMCLFVSSFHGLSRRGCHPYPGRRCALPWAIL
jgi:hypothetical protein